MATDTTTDHSSNDTPADAGVTEDRLVAAFSAAMRANAPRHIVTPGEYDPRSHQHPNKRTAATFKGVWFQNGFYLRDESTSDEEIRLLNRIHRGGRYLDRTVEVVIKENGNDFEGDIRYANATVDQRMANKSLWRTFKELLEIIVTEQDLLDEEEGLTKKATPRASFSSAATRDARAKAGV